MTNYFGDGPGVLTMATAPGPPGPFRLPGILTMGLRPVPSKHLLRYQDVCAWPVSAPLVPCSIALALGIATGLQVPLDLTTVLLLSTLYSVIAYRLRLSLLWLLPVFCLGLLRASLVAYPPTSALPSQVCQVRLQGLIIQTPPPLIFAPHQARLLLQVQAFQKLSPSPTPWIKASDGVVVLLADRPLDWQYGDQILAQGWLSPFKPPSNPGQRDYQRYMYSWGISRCLKVRWNYHITVLQHWVGDPLQNALARLRTYWSRKLLCELGPHQGALAMALLLGDRRLLSPNCLQNFRHSGIIHLLAISGLHISLLVLLCSGLLLVLGVSSGWRLGLTFTLLAAYALLAQLRTPVLRATIWLSLGLGAQLYGRRVRPWNSLACAVILILSIRPQEILAPGFQLSFSACAGILAFFPLLRHCWPKPGDWRHTTTDTSEGLYRLGSGMLSLSLAAWLATFPLCWYHFHLITVLSIPLNLLCIPLTEGILLLGFLFLAGLPVAGPLQVSLWLLNQGASWGSSLGLYWYLPAPPLLVLGMYYVAVYYGLRHPGWYHKWSVVAAIAILRISIAHGPDQSWQVTFLDVGQGSAVYIRLPGPRHLLYDCGALSKSVGRRIILPFLHSQNVKVLEAVVLSHSDRDHCNALPVLLNCLSIKALVINPFFSLRGAHWLAQAQAHNIPIQVIQQQGHLAGLPEISILDPGAAFLSAPDNAHCLVMIIECPDCRFLLTADLAGSGLTQLIEMRLGPFDVLQVPHHGAACPQTPRFLRLWQPRIAVVSAAAYFPHQRTLEHYRHAGVKLYTTYSHGAISLRIYHSQLQVRSFLMPSDSILPNQPAKRLQLSEKRYAAGEPYYDLASY